ncbi:helix-turn-helix domain-containing protein [Flavobacterium sp. HSC-61S13]|uniref:AraC family transcriptional regulator n=1 Tax=Flavobacterium sp. HSC-61S13 TaxID=2910963 RepID=UPI0020A196B8|nr:helix-turn-helix domain-containing protein [Flavobacterium sp. HSC-61S13]MCP1996497.1 AraC-like DNA-binding protein [Flavobacterium sp. HSC-61S13]
MKQFLLLNLQGIKKLQFREVLKVIIAVFAIQIVLVLLNISLYICLMPCMLIYLYKKNINDNFLFKEEYLPIFINFTIFLLILIANLFPHNNLVMLANIGYLTYYTIRISLELKKQRQPSLYSNSKNIISIFNYFSVFAIIVTAVHFVEMNYKRIFGFNIYVIFIGILAMCMVFGLLFLKTFKKEIREEETHTEDSGRLLLEAVKSKQPKYRSTSKNPLANQIILFFETSNLYLNPDFTLLDLTKELGCSRAELSDVLNREMMIGFYSITAMYRIEYAREMLVKKENYTIETLMVECGFQSKSTFNKYFKEYVGVRPSVYRKLNSNFENFKKSK